MIGVYSIAVGDFYIAFAAYSLSVTRHHNPYLPLTLYYSECKVSDYLLDKCTRELDVRLVNLGKVGLDRWSINFLKWEVDLSYLGEVSHYLFLDGDAFITGPLTKDEVESSAAGPLMLARHPNVEKVIKKEKIWTCNEEAAYFIPEEYRVDYFNAGVLLATPEGMQCLRSYMHEKRIVDEKGGWFKTSPYYDENYLNRFALVDHPDKVKVLPWYWDQFCGIYESDSFHICHLAAHGMILPDALGKMRFVRQRHKIEETEFQERFFPEDYFETGWLMESEDRFVLLGLLTALRPRKLVWVGVWKGKDLEVIRRRHPETEIHTIDIDDSNLRETWADEGWFYFYHGDSKDLLPDVLSAVKPDVIMIDGDHKYNAVFKDLERSVSLCPQAIVIAHDAHYPHVRRALADIKGMFPDRGYHELKTPVTHKFGATYGGFFVIDSRKRDFERL